MAETKDSERPVADGGESGGRLSGVRQSASEAYESARARTRTAFATTRETVRGAGQRSVAGLDSNPAVAVIGGLAIGALVAALLPRTRREQDLLGDVGRRLNDTAREAAAAARDAGRRELDEMGISKDGLRRRIDDFTDRAVDAVRESRGGED